MLQNALKSVCISITRQYAQILNRYDVEDAKPNKIVTHFLKVNRSVFNEI